MRYHLLLCFVLLALVSCSCPISIAITKSSDYVIYQKLDLKGGTLEIPVNKRLVFKRGASISNGTVVGNATIIVAATDKIFKGVQIMGTWNITDISSAMFEDIHTDNMLQNLFALTSPNVKNKVTIDPGDYWVTATNEWQTILQVSPNTEVVLNGTIRLHPNKHRGYNIFNLSGDNIYLHGTGCIVGDKENHLGSNGEWGMGINVSFGENINIADLTVKDCWGDCIYIGGNTVEVRINNCHLYGGRRQGVSVTSARKVIIENCTIRNVGGTAPGYAVDVEPNANDSVDYVFIRNVKIINCKGGFMSWHDTSKGSHIGTIRLEHCSVAGNIEHLAYNFKYASKIIISNCSGAEKKIRLDYVDEVELKNNTIKGHWLSTYLITNCRKVTKK